MDSPKRLPSLGVQLPPAAAQRLTPPLLRPALLVALVFVIGMVGFTAIGGSEAGLVDAFYMTSITLTTIGYGEVVRVLHQQLGSSFPAVIGDATDDDVLRAAGAPRASGLIACVSNDNDNLVIVLSARLLAPKLRIVARCVDEREQTKIRRAGADAVVLPHRIGGIRMVSELISPHVVTFLDVMLRDKERCLRFDEVQVPESSPLVGTTIGALHDRKIKDLLVVALREADGTWRYNPGEHERVLPGIAIVFMGSPEARTALERLLVR